MAYDLSNIDLRNLIDTEVKRVAGTGGGEFAGACPFCGGDDRFRVWPTPRNGNPAMWCKQCGFKGDAIAYVMRRESCDFAAALAYLGIVGDAAVKRSKRQRIERPDNAPSPSSFDKPAVENPAWQAAAQDYVLNCSKRLGRKSGIQALEYLKWRGLTERVLEDNLIGYNPTTRRELWGEFPVTLFQGITIPNIFTQRVMAIKTRTWNGKPDKYIQVAGGFQSLYHCGFRVPHFTGQPHRFSTAVLVESELDALSIQAAGGGCLNVTTFATGGSTNCQRLLWVTRVAVCQRVLLAFDNDNAGDLAADWWGSQLGDKAHRLRPLRHDVNEMLTQGDDIEAWLNPHIAPPEYDQLPRSWVRMQL